MIVAIIDDETHCVDRIKTLLKAFDRQLEPVVFNTAEEAIEGLQSLHPNIVFLDIHLHSRTAFEVLSSIGNQNFSLIFTTAFEKYAIDAFKYSAIDYLLKPVDRDEFIAAMQKALNQQEQIQLQERLQVLLSHVTDRNGPRRISIPNKEGYLFLKIDEIIRCQADTNYTHLFTSDGKRYTASKTLKHFENLLSGNNFFRIHHSHLINLLFISSYQKNGYVEMDDGSVLEVSTRRRESFLKAVNFS